jgi:hypothetical protein
MLDMEARRILASFFIIALLLSGYTGGYIANACPILALEDEQFVMADRYRFGEPVARRVFWPANQIDRRVRPDLWTFSW